MPLNLSRSTPGVFEIRRLKFSRYILLLIILLGTILRFYNLAWGDGYFFHPDERNIGIAIGQLNLTDGQLNPQFWAYGSLPIYVIYLTAWLMDQLTLSNWLTFENFLFWAYDSLPIYVVYFTAWLMEQLTLSNWLTFENFLLIGRSWSAVAATVTIPIVFWLTRKILPRNSISVTVGLIAALWVAFLPGLIQFAHFTTFETFLTLEYLVLLIACFRLATRGTQLYFLIAGVVFGLSVGTKITSVVLAPAVIAAAAIYFYNQRYFPAKPAAIKLGSLAIAALLTIFLASPYHFLDGDGFMQSLRYESGVADGSLPVFYTQQFADTIPGFYQLTRVFPYVLTIPLTGLTLVALAHFGFILVKRCIRRVRQYKRFSSREVWLVLILIIVTGYLGFHFTLYVKWTRYMIPSLPFLVILSVVYLTHPRSLFAPVLRHRTLGRLVVGVFSLWIILSGISFWQIYRQPDNRVRAADWAASNIVRGHRIMSEEYDLGILPFNQQLPTQNINLPPFYDLEDRPDRESVLANWRRSDYFVVLSQRIHSPRLRQPDQYPVGASIYQTMFDQRENWRRVVKFSSRNVDCSIWSLYCLGGYFPPDETFTVFDHPEVMIFKKLDEAAD